MSAGSQAPKGRAVGINHVALEVGDIQEALDFYSQILEFEIHNVSDTQAFIYFGDQFINFTKNADRQPDQLRHFGIAVDDKELVRQTLIDMGLKITSGRLLDFHDPWGNQVEITTYTKIQFSKSDRVLEGMGLGHLKKTDEAVDELRSKGLAD